MSARMTPLERRATFSLAGVFALRMLGMFIVLPVFVLYADELRGVTPFLAGVALGAYGLTQALLQIPFGRLSDRYGRKPVMTAGLLLFAAGSVVAALAPDIGWTIAGRALQGSGAVSAVATALLADLTRGEVRTRAMAVVGVTVGASFGLSLVLGPLLDAWVGVRGIFWLTAVAALAGIAVVWGAVPTAPAPVRASGGLWRAMTSRALLPHYGGIFTLHAILTALFVAVPHALSSLPAFADVPHSAVYLPVLLASGVLMLPLVFNADRPGRERPVRALAVLLVAVALAGMALGAGSAVALVVALVVFFTGFNALEAGLPAAVTRAATADGRGAALGAYASSQFAGTFVGGAAGGALYGAGGPTAVLAAAALAAGVWFAFVARRGA